jgi:hypothetical protein
MTDKRKTKTRAPRVVVTPEERYRLINDAAYFREVKHQSESSKPDVTGSWCEVEAEIDTVLKQHHAK